MRQSVSGQRGNALPWAMCDFEQSGNRMVPPAPRPGRRWRHPGRRAGPGERTTPMTAASPANPPLQWQLFIRRRASATQGTPPGKDELKWVSNTVTLIHGESEALLVDTFLSEAHTAELADWIAGSGKRLS